jgi:NhaA family Na+:H+ antiporter
LFFTVVALVWANSPWAEIYEHLWEIPFNVGFGGFVLSKPLHAWINDGLMAVFFFAVGLELKREILVGELSSPRQAALPIAAALGGMLVPAGIYLLINRGAEGASGWGIPMATDIAFSLGVLTLLGKRVPLALKVFLVALAIADDIGAVLVIAFFYTSHISWMNLLVGTGFLIALLGANWAGVRHPLIYAILGIGGLWLAFLLSGVHATIGGVLAAFTIPARTRIDPKEFVVQSRELISDFEGASGDGKGIWTNKDQQTALHVLENNCERVQTPLQRLEEGLHPWVTYLILPLFALANAGVPLRGDPIATLSHPVTLGIVLGLLMGKQVGITLFAFLAVKLRMAKLPDGVSWRHIYGVGLLGGIGFTMSLFISGLAFGESPLLIDSKLGILLASLAAGIGGWLFLRLGRSSSDLG